MPTTIVALDGWDSVVGWGESPWDSGRIDLAEMQGEVGSVGVSSPAVFVTGVSASGAVGEVIVPQSPSVSVTGVSAACLVGSVTLRIDSPVSVTGVSAACLVGSVTLTLGTAVSVAGVSATGYVGSVLLWDQIVPAQSPDWIEIAA
jgi:hypothetical protein